MWDRLSGIFAFVMDGILSKSVILRPKAGFIVPTRARLVGGRLGLIVTELLSPASVRTRDLFESYKAQRIIVENQRDEAHHPLHFWALLTPKLWQHTLIDRDGSTPLESLLSALAAVKIT